MSNAVNLTDGMDGLATGCVSLIALVLILLSYIASETMAAGGTWAGYLLLPHIPRAGELSVFYSAMLGACLGFLWFNCYKAGVFMGDTGSLPLGAAIGCGAVVTRHEILLFVIGGGVRHRDGQRYPANRLFPVDRRQTTVSNRPDPSPFS